MATVTAAISLSSDIADATMTLSKSSTLTKAGSSKGLDTSTYTRKTFTAVTHVDLVSASGYSAGANKVYICNAGTSPTEYVTIGLGNNAADGGTAAEPIGRLYGGDWMYFPWDGGVDITITPSVATETIVDYLVIS
tara:strand:- start:270 stop:677 length:408 start_codon:yes stop_codon:yes gene_type:complete